MRYDFDDVNAILAALADADIVEPMAEPIDEPDCHPLDAAFVMGIENEVFDEMYVEPQTMVDENGFVWYVS